MKCISCSNSIDPKMKVAVGCNACPFCGEPIMNEKRHGQMLQLDRVLTNARFTNSESIDVKLKEKVITLLLEHFEFKRTTSAPVEEDVIVLDSTESVSPAPVKKVPAEEPEVEEVPEEVPQEERAPDVNDLTAKVREAKRQAAETQVDEVEVQKLLKGYEQLIGGVEELPDPDINQIETLMAGGSTMQQIEKMKAKHLDAVGSRERGDNRSIRRAD